MDLPTDRSMVPPGCSTGRAAFGTLTRSLELVRNDTADEVGLGGTERRHQIVELLLRMGRPT